MITSFVQYLLLLPSYVNILLIYAFCNLHDVSWGTKGDNGASKDLGAAKKVDKDGQEMVSRVICVTDTTTLTPRPKLPCLRRRRTSRRSGSRRGRSSACPSRRRRRSEVRKRNGLTRIRCSGEFMVLHSTGQQLTPERTLYFSSSV